MWARRPLSRLTWPIAILLLAVTRLHAEQLLDLSNEILKLIDLKGAVDQAALEVGIENNDPAGPITVDLVHNAR